MEAAQHTTGLDYQEYAWGDLIKGTKEQLQAIGIGRGKAFPGEPGANKVEMTVCDPQGNPVRISNRHHTDGRFTAFRGFAGWPVRPDLFVRIEAEPFPGVSKVEYWSWDEFLGTAESLVAAGLVQAHQFPGMPGQRKRRVHIYADGTEAPGSRYVDHRRAAEPGARTIERKTTQIFSVSSRISWEEATLRCDVVRAAQAAWEDAVMAMQRPDRLTARLMPMRPSSHTNHEARQTNGADAAQVIGIEDLREIRRRRLRQDTNQPA